MAAKALPFLYVAMLLWSCGSKNNLLASCSGDGDCHAPSGSTAACIGSPGLCSWTCGSDADCSGPGNDSNLVCANSKGATGKHCFPGCENGPSCPSDLKCQTSGTSGQNRNVCLPG